jgi:hypothetical protein
MEFDIEKLKKIAEAYLSDSKQDTRYWARIGLAITGLCALFIFIANHEFSWEWQHYFGLLVLTFSGWVFGKEIDKKRIRTLEYKGEYGLALCEILKKVEYLKYK